MSNLEKQLLNSAQEGAEGSGNSVGAHLVSKLAKGNADPKLLNEEIRQKLVLVRGGRGSKGEPSEIAKSIKKAQEEEVRIDHDLAKIANDKEGLLFSIADLRIKERQAVEEKLSSITIEKIRKELAEAQGKIEKINGILPESEAVKDHKQIQSIMNEWYGGKRDWKKEMGRFKKAEKVLEVTPRDRNALREANSARAEMKETEERIEAIAKEAKNIIENTNPSSVRNMSIHHTNEETIEEKKYIEKRHAEKIAPGIFGHKNENADMQSEMDKLTTSSVSDLSIEKAPEPATIDETGLEEKIMKEELPPLEFTLETPKKGEDIARVEERIKEVSARQAELEAEPKGPFQKSAIGEEVAELEKEMASLEERRKEIEVKKPLQSAYDMAMDRIWKENEEKRNAVLGKIPEADIEHDIETHNALLPLQIEEDVVGTPREGQEAAFKKFEDLAEKKVSEEYALSIIASLQKTIESEAESKKVPEGWIRRTGEAWNKVPTRYKLLITAGMVASGVGSAAVGATSAVGTIAVVGAGLRAIGGAGLFVAIEKGLKNRAEKKGGERSGFGEIRDTTLSAALSIIIVGVLPNMARDLAVEHGFFQKISEFFKFGNTQVEAPIKTVNYVETAKAGDSIWKMAEHQLEANYGEKFTSLSPEKQTYLIDAVKDKVTLGMSEEAANTLAVGQSMDFKSVLTDKDFMSGMFSNAQNLNTEQITNIQNYDASAPTETPEKQISVEEFLNEPLHTKFTLEETSAVAPSQMILSPEQTTPTQEAQPKDYLMEGYTPNELPEKPAPTSFIQQEILPVDTTKLAYIEKSADAILSNDMDVLFGEPKFLWFGHTNGIDSINWKDSQVGFEGKTVTEIMNSNPSATTAKGVKTFGIENYEATSKMKEYLASVTSMTGVNPNSNEKVVGFIHRASVAKLS